ncbi:Flavodoxin-1 [Candidatus Moranella endobia PCVAL]|uniref:Flavodoxin n=1 Tax=Moranella endobia (strain PCIT) TaxID=903503 RepID=F7XY36_MOREP|nr:flavodoxin FldA [Candidatus Moranella endobia]AEI75012.1 flavodoxin FldA [Candidatus Moranella endobia PCIT]AGJ61260.1 Flavodoxin-1 [Candidatus Moranella endobia PCVAL]
MAYISIVFGSDTGNTENIAKMLQQKLGTEVADLFDIANSSEKDLEQYDRLLLGIPTWYYGEAQCDWDDFFPRLENIDFSSKMVAIFGCGDQEDYAEYFCDAMGTLRDIIEPKGATMVGHWPTSGYHFHASKGMVDDAHFIGLAIDEDRQPELTSERVDNWINQVRVEMNLS